VDNELAALKAERLKASAPPPPYIPKELPSPGGGLSSTARAGEKAKA
jgi:hypothetical protein